MDHNDNDNDNGYDDKVTMMTTTTARTTMLPTPVRRRSCEGRGRRGCFGEENPAEGSQAANIIVMIMMIMMIMIMMNMMVKIMMMMIMMGMMNMMMHDDYDQAKVGMGTRPHPQSLLSQELRRMRGRGCPS